MRKTISISVLVLLLGIGSCIMFTGAASAAVLQYYVAYTGQGSADGSSPENAAQFRSTELWDQVRRDLDTSAVTVNFMPGDYIFSKNPGPNGEPRDTFKLDNIGNSEHLLTIQGLHKEGTNFKTDPADPIVQELAFDMFFFHGTNALIRNFHFSGKQFINYVTKLHGSHVTMADCTFIDMHNVIYGATGAHNAYTEYITVRDNVFIRIGFDSHAHMMYNAYGPQHIYVVNNYFEDTSGDYVRFRDRTDYCVVFGNTFKSTGTYRNTNRTFVIVPLFNDDVPGSANAKEESFGTHMLVANNKFIYPDDNTGGSRQTFYFLSSGYTIPGRQYLLDVKEAQILMRGTVEEKKALMKEQLGIDGDTVFYYGNVSQGRNVSDNVSYYAYPAYGAVSRGWTSPIDITDAVVTTSVAETTAEALAFWDKYIESKRYFASPRIANLEDPEVTVQLKTPEYPVSHVVLSLDDKIIYEGKQIPEPITLQTAELATGQRQFSVQYTDDAGKTYTDQTALNVMYYHLANSDAGWTIPVKGVITLYSDSVLRPADYKSVTAYIVPIVEGERLPGQQLYTGSALPHNLSIDTMQYTDGAYDIDITTTTTAGVVDHRKERILIDNWTTLEDPITAPVYSWFGQSDRLLTVDRSSGWDFTDQASETFFGDAERIKPQANAKEYLTWELADLNHFVFTVYARPGHAETGVVISVSADGQTWTEVPYVVNSQEQSGGPWAQLLLAGVVPGQIEARFVKFQVSTGANAADAIELGHVSLYAQAK